MLVSCADPAAPAENAVTQAEGESCRWPPVGCYPLEDGPRYCSLACGNVLAYCRDYPDSAYIYCRTHPTNSRCSPIGEPLYESECILGAPATPPERDAAADPRQRIRTIRAARGFANHGMIEEAREMYARVGLRYAPANSQ
ncbi:MAG TPA: hypothetical protein VF469_25265 [Kofleriaceae bacterium]